MFQKLTANLKKSQQYGKKTVEQLSKIGNDILKNKLQISSIQQQIQQAMRQDQKLNISLKRQNEEQSNYDYKLQKLQIRFKQYNRKLVLQQQIHDKKLCLRDSMLKKIEKLQKDIQNQSKNDEQINKYRKQIQEASIKVNKQTIEIQNLYYQLMGKNKTLRSKQDQLMTKKKSNKKKTDNIAYLQNLIKSQSNKENVNTNSSPESSNSDILKLQKQKCQTDKVLSHNTDILLKMCQQFDKLSQSNSNLKKQLNKDWQFFQQIRSHKQSVTKLKDSFTKINN